MTFTDLARCCGKKDDALSYKEHAETAKAQMPAVPALSAVANWKGLRTEAHTETTFSAFLQSFAIVCACRV